MVGKYARSDIPRYLRLLRQGRMHLDNIVSARYQLKDINSAIDAMRRQPGALWLTYERNNMLS